MQGFTMHQAQQPPKYRAIRWSLRSDEACPVSQHWHATPEEATREAMADFAPHRAASYEIECSDGARWELSACDYGCAMDAYRAAIAFRDALGVWG